MNDSLVQGSPCSPIISNIVLRKLDAQLQQYAQRIGATYTRYADDIVFSGDGDPPEGIAEEIRRLVVGDGWTISEHKTRLDRLPNRLKVHGLLVHGDELRLTKGYRNRIRAYRHLIENKAIDEADMLKILGHINYAKQVERFAGE